MARRGDTERAHGRGSTTPGSTVRSRIIPSPIPRPREVTADDAAFIVGSHNDLVPTLLGVVKTYRKALHEAVGLLEAGLHLLTIAEKPPTRLV